jgi:hypothetical protein
MIATLVRATTDPTELALNRLELAALEDELVQRELALNTLQAELGAFGRRYLRVVGTRYAELDTLEAQIAAAFARRHPQDAPAQQHAEQTRTKAEESAQAAGTAKRSKRPERFKPSDELKKLYHEIAKRIHPDLSADETERAHRTEWMMQVNRAYTDGDETRLRRLAQQWNDLPDAVDDDTPMAELSRLQREIAQVRGRLIEIVAEIKTLTQSDLYQLHIHVEEAERQGRDLLAEMSANVIAQIERAHRRLDQINEMRFV